MRLLKCNILHRKFEQWSQLRGKLVCEGTRMCEEREAPNSRRGVCVCVLGGVLDVGVIDTHVLLGLSWLRCFLRAIQADL